MFEYRLFQGTNILTTRSGFQDVQRKYFELLDREFHDILKDAEGFEGSVLEIIEMLWSKESNVLTFYEQINQIRTYL
jgi:hypothetical protein